MSDSGARRLTVNEYKGRRLVEEWDSLTECAKHHGVKQATIKELIHYGDSRRGHTFDIPTDSPYDTRENKTTGALEIYNTETGLVLNGGASRRGDHGDAGVSRLQRSGEEFNSEHGYQQGLSSSRTAKRNSSDPNLQATGA
jgi:hypothetical protein